MNQQSLQSYLSSAFLVVTTILFAIFGYNYLTSYPPLLCAVVAGLFGMISYYVFRFFNGFIINHINKVSSAFYISILSFFWSIILLKIIGFRLPENVYYLGILGLVACIIGFFWSLARLKQTGSKVYLLGLILPLFVVLFGIYWLSSEGSDPHNASLKVKSNIDKTHSQSAGTIENPTSQGQYKVNRFTYGSGDDFRRKEYAEEVRFKTESVDASLLIPAWKGKLKKWRERYWHFGVKELPVNGRVYLPESKGSSPLVLIVHGNHSMIDYSDGGYAYLGETLASLGYAVVSVDENFLNGHWSGDFRGKEMPARAWLLLKHLEQWEEWNANPEHDMYKKIDMDKIMLIGHSRGGEAVSIAAKFNTLNYFPDNAKEQFDFNFKIKSVISIAPTDYRYHRQMDLENINYLSIQGSYDSDEISFWGMRPYHRLKFTDNHNWVKTGVYIHRANHGQFNSSWGRSDMGAPFKWLLNTKPMISEEDQRTAANVFITAFAEATLNDKNEYLQIFYNTKNLKEGLPVNDYLTQIQKSGDLLIQDYEEDIELSSGRNDLKISGKNLKVWREENLSTRDNGSQENNAVVLGWDYGDKVNMDSLASYSLQINDNLRYGLDTVKSMILRVATGDQKDLQRDDEQASPKDPKLEKGKELPSLLDFSVKLVDSLGQITQIKLSDIKAIAPILKTRFTKLKSLDKDMFGSDWEVQLQTFVLPLDKFKKLSNRFDMTALRDVLLVFDQNSSGVVVVDDIGFSY